MTITTKIDPNKIEAYAQKVTLNKLKITSIVFGGFSILLLIILKFHPFAFIFPIVYVFLTLLIYIFSKEAAKNMAESLEIMITDEAVIYHHSKNSLNGMVNLSMEINNMRFGSKFDKVFPFSKIEYTTLKEDHIAITSTDVSLFDENNLIKIPSECEDYEKIIELIQSNPKKFKLIKL